MTLVQQTTSLISRQFSFCQVLTLSFGTPSTSTSLRSLFRVSSQSSSVTFFVPFVRPVEASSDSVGAWRSRADLARRGLWKWFAPRKAEYGREVWEEGPRWGMGLFVLWCLTALYLSKNLDHAACVALKEDVAVELSLASVCIVGVIAIKVLQESQNPIGDCICRTRLKTNTIIIHRPTQWGCLT